MQQRKWIKSEGFRNFVSGCNV